MRGLQGHTIVPELEKNKVFPTEDAVADACQSPVSFFGQGRDVMTVAGPYSDIRSAR
jgi:hypothetical protein